MTKKITRKAVQIAILTIALLITAGCTTADYQVQPVPTTEAIIVNETVSEPTETIIQTPAPAARFITITPTAPTLPAVSPTSDHISKYADYNPALSVIPMGTALIITGGLDSNAAIHINSTDNNSTVELLVNITPDGNSNRLILIPGNYTSVLPDRYGNGTEQHNFYVGPNSMTYVAFNGYSYRQSVASGGC